MQIQPFRRPNIIDAETTRDAIVRHLAEIRELYAQRNRTLFACDAAGNSDAHLRPADFIATIAEPLKPKPGDLHDWDKLVDGCLYFDTDANDNRPYLVLYEGGWLWSDCDGSIEAEWAFLSRQSSNSPTAAHVARRAKVVAVGLTTAEEFAQAIADHHDSLKSGGAT